MKKSVCTLFLLLFMFFAAESGLAQCGCKKSYRLMKRNFWQLIQLNGRPIRPEKGILKMKFLHSKWKQEHIYHNPMRYPYEEKQYEEKWNRIKGFAVCNEFEAAYQADEKRNFRIGPIIKTRCGCDGLELEREFLQMLESATNYDMDGPLLLLLSDGEIRAVFQAL